MNEEETTRLQALIDRFRQGNDSARDKLVERALDRLRRLTGTLLQSFPGLKAAHGADSVLNQDWERFHRTLESRLALELLRASQAQGRAGTTKALDKARAT